MTVKELSKLYRLNREIEQNIKQLDNLELQMQEDESLLIRLRETMYDVSAPPLSDMPKAHNVGSPVESKALRAVQLENNIAKKKDAITDIRIIISTRQTLCLLERKRLEEYICDIDDSLTRQIFTLRFVNGLTWDQVAASIGYNSGGESVRVACYRYLKTHK